MQLRSRICALSAARFKGADEQRVVLLADHGDGGYDHI
jgi:hypothetical protein